MTTTTTTPVAHETHIQGGMPENLKAYLVEQYGWIEDYDLKPETRYVRITVLEPDPDSTIIIYDFLNGSFESIETVTFGA